MKSGKEGKSRLEEKEIELRRKEGAEEEGCNREEERVTIKSGTKQEGNVESRRMRRGGSWRWHLKVSGGTLLNSSQEETKDFKWFDGNEGPSWDHLRLYWNSLFSTHRTTQSNFHRFVSSRRKALRSASAYWSVTKLDILKVRLKYARPLSALFLYLLPWCMRDCWSSLMHTQWQCVVKILVLFGQPDFAHKVSIQGSWGVLSQT